MDNTYNPKIRLDIDTSKALKNIQKVNEEAQKTIATLEEKKELTIEEKATLQKLQAVERESENLKTVLESIKKIDLNLNVQPILKAIEQCEHAIRDLNTATQTGADTIDRNMSKAAKEMSNEFSAVLKDLKSDILQFFSNFSHTPDTQGLDELVKKLDEIKKKIEQINKSTIKVQVMNEGFDEMIEKANNHLNYLNRQLKYTASQFRKTKSGAGYLKSDVAATAEDMDLVARRSAQTNVQINRGTKNMTNFGKKAKEAEKSLKKTKEHTTKISDVLLKSFYSLRGVASAFEQAQNFAYNMWQYVASMGRSLVSTVVPALKEITSSAFEMESAFETARISYQLFFPNENPDDIISEIKRRAIANPAFNSSDLTNYVSQFAPLAEGDSKLALDAVEGIAAMLEASGQEVSTYMQRLVTNTTQIVSTGKATARDWNEFLRATTVFETVIAEITPELREKLGDEFAEVTKSDVSQLLHALQIVRNDSSISGVPERYAQTYAGLKQQLEETIQTTTDSIIMKTGFYKTVKKWLDQTDGFAKMLEEFLAPLYQTATKLLNKIKIEDISDLLREIFEALSDVVRFAIETLKEVTGEADVRKVISRVITFVRDMLKGFINGVKDVINFMKWMEKNLNISNLGSIVGWLASPAGRGLTQLFSAASGIVQSLANMGTLFKLLKDSKLFGGGVNASTLSASSTIAEVNAAVTSKTSVSKLSKILSTGVSKLVGGVATVVFTHFATELAATLSGGNTVATAATGAITGAIGGGMIGGPLGAAIGGLIGGFMGATQAAEAFRKKILELVDETVDKITQARKEASSALTDETMKIMEKLGYAIDTNSDAGRFAYNQVKAAYTSGEITDVESAVKLAYEQYLSKQLGEALDKYTESVEFRALAEGDKFVYEGTNLSDAQKAKRDQLANLIKMVGLNGDTYYDYSQSNEKIISDYFNGNTMTNAQVDALIEEYQRRYNEMTVAQDSMETDLSTRLGELGDAMSGWNTTMDKLNTAIDTLNGNLKNQSEERKYDPETGLTHTEKLYVDTESMEVKTEKSDYKDERSVWQKIIDQATGKRQTVYNYHGGFIKPVYKASGGAIGVDTVPAMLQRGEFVVRKSVVDKVGLSAMNALNWGDSKLAATLMGRPSSISDNHSASYSRTSNYNDRKVNQYVQVINRNNSGAGNSYLRLGHRLALGGLI